MKHILPKLRARSKKSKTAVRFFTYGVMTISTIVITSIVTLFAIGYRFDRENLSFEQGGLVQFRSNPDVANVTVDGARQPFTTPGKVDLAAGQHSVELTKNGYEPWRKTVDLAAGQLLWLNYARLFPTDIATNPIKEYDAIASTTYSPDRKYLIIHQTSASPDFQINNIDNEERITDSTISVPESKYTVVANAERAFSVIEWDITGRYFIVKYQSGDVTEYLRLNRSNQNDIVNISQVFNLPISEIHFNGDNPNSFYVNNNATLRRLDIGSSSSASASLINELRSFIVYGDGSVSIVATKERTAGDTNSRYQYAGMLINGSRVVEVREYPIDHNLLIDYSEYFNNGYLGVTDTTTQIVDIIRDPSEQGNSENRLFATMNLPVGANWLTFSNNGRMLMAQTAGQVTVYDLEIAKQYSYTISTGAAITTPFQWIDDYYLYSDSNKTVRLFEFDGNNQREITGVEPGYGVTFSSDGEHLITTGRNSVSDKYELQLSRLVLKN